jgi:hypothetical protein
MKASQLTELTAPLPIEYRGLAFTIHYFTEKFFDSEVQGALQEIFETAKEDAGTKPTTDEVKARLAENARRDAEFFKSVFASWDIERDEGEGYEPITVDYMAKWGAPLRMIVTQALMEDAFRPLAKGTGSPTGSSRTESTDDAPGGTDPLET